MKIKKTTIEELNYRFIKELLNDRVYKTFLQLCYEREHRDFNYDAWCKGLFRGDEKYYLAHKLSEYSEYAFSTDDHLGIDLELWNCEYGRHDSFIDIINIKELKDMVLNNWIVMDFITFGL